MVVVDACIVNPTTVLDWELRSAKTLCTFLQFQAKTLPQLIDKRFMASWLLFPSYFKVQKVRIVLGNCLIKHVVLI